MDVAYNEARVLLNSWRHNTHTRHARTVDAPPPPRSSLGMSTPSCSCRCRCRCCSRCLLARHRPPAARSRGAASAGGSGRGWARAAPSCCPQRGARRRWMGCRPRTTASTRRGWGSTPRSWCSWSHRRSAHSHHCCHYSHCCCPPRRLWWPLLPQRLQQPERPTRTRVAVLDRTWGYVTLVRNLPLGAAVGHRLQPPRGQAARAHSHKHTPAPSRAPCAPAGKATPAAGRDDAARYSCLVAAASTRLGCWAGLRLSPRTCSCAPTSAVPGAPSAPPSLPPPVLIPAGALIHALVRRPLGAHAGRRRRFCCAMGVAAAPGEARPGWIERWIRDRPSTQASARCPSFCKRPSRLWVRCGTWKGAKGVVKGLYNAQISHARGSTLVHSESVCCCALYLVGQL